MTKIAFLIQIVLIFLSVAFFTLFERKVMGSFHLRKGPNKVMFFGLVQPLLDAFKLLSKQWVFPQTSNSSIYLLSPAFSLLLSLWVWVNIPTLFFSFSITWSMLLFMMISSFLVIPNLLSGWASNSKYSFIGSLRSVAQSISYEAVMTTVFVMLLVMSLSFSVSGVNSMWSLMTLLFLPIWLICLLAEGHRAPFDFSEAESELVSGYNTEYAGAGFAFLFLAEYSMLLFGSMLTAVAIFGVAPLSILSALLHVLCALALTFFFTWIRITYCRFRYDFLMMFAWKKMLPICLILCPLIFL